MLTVREIINKINEKLAPHGIPVSHFKADLSKMPLAVFSETGEEYIFADNEIVETTLSFDFTFLTKIDEEYNKELIKKVLAKIGATFGYKAHYNYETDTIMHVFSCEIAL